MKSYVIYNHNLMNTANIKKLKGVNVMNKLIKDFLSGDSSSWTLKHYMVYIPLAMMLGIYHSFLIGVIKTIIL